MIKRWYLKLRIKMTIAEIKRKKLPIPKGSEQEMEELLKAFEAYKKHTIEKLQNIYEIHSK